MWAWKIKGSGNNWSILLCNPRIHRSWIKFTSLSIPLLVFVSPCSRMSLSASFKCVVLKATGMWSGGVLRDCHLFRFVFLCVICVCFCFEQWQFCNWRIFETHVFPLSLLSTLNGFLQGGLFINEQLRYASSLIMLCYFVFYNANVTFCIQLHVLQNCFKLTVKPQSLFSLLDPCSFFIHNPHYWKVQSKACN